MPPGYVLAPTREPDRLSELSVAVSVLFGCVAVAQLLDAVAGHSGTAKGVLSAVNALAIVSLAPVYLVWFFKARRNAGLWGPQRRSQGWSIGAWFTPVVFLWFPYQILTDIWRASAPAPATRHSRRSPDAVVTFWWACWILSWATGIFVTHKTTTLPDGTAAKTDTAHLLLGGTIVSNLFAAVAAVLGALVVIKVTQMQEARRPTLR